MAVMVFVPFLKHGNLESVAECLIHIASWGTCIKHGSLWLISLQDIPWLLKIKSLHHWVLSFSLSLSLLHTHTFFVLTGNHLHLNLSMWAIHSFRNPYPALGSVPGYRHTEIWRYRPCSPKAHHEHLLCAKDCAVCFQTVVLCVKSLQSCPTLRPYGL